MVAIHASGRNVKEPFPYYGRIGDFPMMLALQSRDGTHLVGQVPPDQGSATPTEIGEQGENAELGSTIALRDLTRGYGQRRQRTKLPNGRYSHTTNVRLRSGLGVLGPEITSYTPSTTDATLGITRKFEIVGQYFAIAGRYCLTGSTTLTGWTVSKDFGVGKAAVDAIVVQTNQGGSVRYAFVAMGDSEPMWYFDGTTWTQTTGGNVLYARAFAVDALTFYRFADTNTMYTLDLGADPLIAANWASATDGIGTKDYPVVRAEVNAAGALIVYKQDDAYDLNADGSVNQLFGRQQFPAAATNGEALTRWGNDSYVVYGGRLFRISPDLGYTPVGPELLKDNGSDVKGIVTALCGTDHFLLAALYNPDSGNSYLLEWDGTITEDDLEKGKVIPAWHGSICDAFASKKITMLELTTISAATYHKIMTIGFSDGTIAKYGLACTPDPADCTAERFSTSVGYIYYSRQYFVFASQRKALLNATGEGDNFAATTYAQLAYRGNASGSYVNMSAAFDSGQTKRVLFPDSLSCQFLDMRLALTSSANTATPQFSGLAIEWQLRTQPQEIMQVSVIAEDGQRLRDGTPYWYGAEEVRDRINSLAGIAGGVTFIDPNGESHQVTLLTPRRTTAWDVETKRPRDAITCLLKERRPNENYGILSRLGAMTLRQMSAYPLRELASI